MDAPPTILVVEDDEKMRNAIVRLFAYSGWDVAAAEGLAEATDRLDGASRPFGVAVVDLMLIDGEGAQVVALIRRASGGSTRIVVCTACHEEEGRVSRAVDAGADTVVYKPFDFLRQLLPAAKGEPFDPYLFRGTA